MPRLQLGLYMMSGREAKESVRYALAHDYRGFDSAQMYRNEREAGEAIREFLASTDNSKSLTREDIFYTSKLSSNSTSYEAVRRSIKKSVENCGLGYIDLFLLHSPYGGAKAREVSWRAVEDAIDAGELRSGGVSNYGPRHVSLFLVYPSRNRKRLCHLRIITHRSKS
jgi:diketogulonate reductase-like aldo/keto reductase